MYFSIIINMITSQDVYFEIDIINIYVLATYWIIGWDITIFLFSLKLKIEFWIFSPIYNFHLQMKKFYFKMKY
jgi:hypothetical protein